MAITICHSRDCDVYCLELDEFDGLQIVVKVHNYDNVNKEKKSQAEKSIGDVKNTTTQSTPSNTEVEKQMERRKNQLQRCLFTNNRPATHSQPEIHVNKKPYACNLCDRKYSWRSSLSFHKRIHTGHKIQQCIECDKKFLSKGRFEKHLKTHQKEITDYTCCICDRKFQQKSSLTYHLRKHENLSYPCRICEKEYRYRASFNNHMRLQHKCIENKQCVNSVSSDTTMIKSTQSYNCSICEKQFSHDSNLYAHLKVHDWCQNVKSSINADNIVSLTETSITTSTTPQMCSIVPNTTVPATTVNDNMIQRSSSIANTTVGLKNFFEHETTLCLPLLDSKIMSTTLENFVDHGVIHCLPPVDIKNMSDSLSNSGDSNNPRASTNFKTQPSVSTNVNQKHHSTRNSSDSNIYSSSTPVGGCAVPRRPNIKPISTCVGCNMTQPTSCKSNRTVSPYTGRREVHSKLQAYTDLMKCSKDKKLTSLENDLDRPYNCTTCLSEFIRKYDLDRHTRMHTGDKPYQCQDCGMQFSENYRLKSHRKRHQRFYECECPVCGKLFLKHSTLNTHMKIHNWRESI